MELFIIPSLVMLQDQLQNISKLLINQSYYLQVKQMSKLPNNVQYFLEQNKQKMKGNKDSTLKAIHQSVQLFNKQRCEEVRLRAIQIYPYQNQKGIEHELLYEIKIKGRKNSYYQYRILTFYLFFFDDYPKEPPEIVAANVFDHTSKREKRFLHINIAQNGHLCMGTNHSKLEYYDNTTLKEILIELENMIYYPNIESSFNSEIFAAYNEKGANSLYYQLLNAQAKLLELNQSQSQSQDQAQKQSS